MPSQRGQRGLNRAKGRFRRAGISLGSRHSTVDRPILFRKDPEDNAARKQGSIREGEKKRGRVTVVLLCALTYSVCMCNRYINLVKKEMAAGSATSIFHARQTSVQRYAASD